MAWTQFKTLLIKVPRLLRFLFSHASFREKLYWICMRSEIRFVKVKIRGNIMWLNLKDSVLSTHLFFHREKYEAFEVFLIEQVTKKGMTFVDIGACMGYHTLVGSRCVGKAGSVVAFEPAPDNHSLLMRNIRANHISNVHVINAAVMDYQGTTDLYLSGINFGDHRVYDAMDEKRFNEGGRRQRISIPCVRIDDVLKDYESKADVIKMDVQGAEMSVFRGMKKTLANPEVIVFCEFWPYGLRNFGSSPGEMLAFFDSLGFAMYEIFEEQQRIGLVDSDELINRFSDLGHSNLVCFRPNSSSSGVFAAYVK
jgi:FkbM family methyltransferase